MKRELVLKDKKILDDGDCYVIAEIGHNHQGNIDIAKEMISVAKDCGANAVKLQKRDNKSLYTKEIYDSPYVNENSYAETYGAHREALEFGREEYAELISFAKEKNIDFFATAFDFKSADFLIELDVPAFKIASGDLTNTPLLKYVAQYGKPMFVSTGGATMEDVKRAYDTIMPVNSQLCLMHCTAAYPIYNYEDINLNVIKTYREAFRDIVIGMSDHESGISMALAAYVLGARVVEKHFTLNRAWKGTDHSFSLAPVGLKRLVKNLRRAKAAMGDGVKRKLPCEEKPLYKMSKKLVAARDLPSGHILEHEDIAIKSPGDGLPPYAIEQVLGKKLRRSLKEDENINLEEISS